MSGHADSNGVTNDPMPLCHAVGDMMIAAIEMQLSIAETQDRTRVESEVLVLLDLLEKMAKRFHGIRTQVCSSSDGCILVT